MGWLDQFMNSKQREVEAEKRREEAQEQLERQQALRQKQQEELQLQAKIARIRPILYQKLAAIQARALLTEVQKYWRGAGIWQAEEMAEDIDGSSAVALGLLYVYTFGPDWNFRGDRSGSFHAYGKPFYRRLVSTVGVGVLSRYDYNTQQDQYLAYVDSFRLQKSYSGDEGKGLENRAKKAAVGGFYHDKTNDLYIEVDVTGHIDYDTIEKLQKALKEDTWRRHQDKNLPGM